MLEKLDMDYATLNKSSCFHNALFREKNKELKLEKTKE